MEVKLDIRENITDIRETGRSSSGNV